MELSRKYLPLFQILKDKHKQVDTVILTGGRASGKSKGVGLFSAEALIQYDWKILYTRFTNVSITDSIKPELTEALEDLNYTPYVTDNNSRITSNVGKGLASFKGINTGSKNQKANLKSLKGFNLFIVDEAEEIPDYKTFKKVFYSVRSVDKRNLSVLILNPTSTDHFIYETFFEGKNVPAGFNGIKDNVMYIHTSYKDVNPKFIPENIRNDYERLKLSDPQEYESVVMGGWSTQTDGALFTKDQLQWYDTKDLKQDALVSKVGFIDVADEGTDSLAFAIGYLIHDKIYLEDVYFTTDNTDVTTPECAHKSREHQLNELAIETNNHGAIFYRTIERLVGGTNLIPVHQQTNKHSRILAQASFIRKHFVFRNDYEHGSDYDLFMREVFKYTKDGKAAHDDAPDSLTGLSIIVQDLFSYIWY